jgi:HK97 family phage major capsid protein
MPPTAPKPKLTREQEWKAAQHRFLTIEKAESGESQDPNRIAVGFSSEEPYERWWGFEILSHAPEHVDLSRLQNGAPFLLGHETDERFDEMVLGVLENVRIESDRRGRSEVLFSDNERPQRILKDIKKGIRKKISVGYQYLRDPEEMKPEEMSPELKEMCLRAGKKAYRCAWMPYEVSSVAIAADDSVGVGRDMETETEPAAAAAPPAEPAPSADRAPESIPIPADNLVGVGREHSTPQSSPEVAMSDTLKPTPEEVERQRIAEIEAVGAKFAPRLDGGKSQMDQLVRDAIELKVPAEQFRGEVFLQIKDGRPLETPLSELGLSAKDLSKYSLRRAIAARLPESGEKAEFEMEISREIAKKAAKPAEGFYVPYEVEQRMRFINRVDASRIAELKRTLSVGTSTAGGNLVGTDFLAGEYIDALRNASLFIQLGAVVLPGLVGNVAIPKKTANSTAYWVSTEGSAPSSASQPTFGQVTLSPKTGGNYIDMTRQLLLQARPEIDRLVEMDLVDAVGTLIDLAGFHGSGSSGQPTGIAGVSGVGTFAGTTFSRTSALDALTDIRVANADRLGQIQFVTNPTIYGMLEGRPEVAAYPKYIVENGKMVGYPIWYTQQISANYMFAGVFSQALLGEFGMLDINVDPFTYSTSGTVRIVALKSVDVAVRHAGAFTYASNVS